MPNLYMPSEQNSEYLNGLTQGFILENRDDQGIALLIKAEPSIINSIINGCKIGLVVRNPNIRKRSCTLYIYDTPNNPFFVTWHEFSLPDKKFPNFDEVIINLALNSQSLTLALFNELSHPIFSTKLEISINHLAFMDWLDKTEKDQAYQNLQPDPHGNYLPETVLKGFEIKILNQDNSKTEKLKIIAPEYEEGWRQNASSQEGFFSYDHYIDNGKHGNYQELGITNNLAKFFKPDIDLFISPKHSNNKEFTDYIILNNNAAIAIESKYILSDKTTKRHQAIHKAITQLNKVEDEILNKDFKLSNLNLNERLKSITVVLKICLLNDRIILDENNSKSLIRSFTKAELPLFMSVTTFFDLLTSLSLKNKPYLSNNLFANTIGIFNKFFENDDMKINYLRYFSVEGLTVEELNALAIKNNNMPY